VSELVRIRRILVALDASRQSEAALAAAARLAEELEAELLGMFVEDVNLLRLAALPFAREIGHATARARRLEDVDMARALRAQAARAEQALADTMAGRRVPWSFRVARGQVAAVLLEAAQEADLVALGVTRVLLTRGVRLGSTSRAVLAGAARPLLLLPHGAQLGPPYVLVYDGSAAAERAAAAAFALLDAHPRGGLTVLLVPDGLDTAHMQQAIAAHFTGMPVSLRPVSPVDPAGLARAIRAAAPGTVLLPASHRLLVGPGLEKLLEELRCAAIVVR
jgi:nucleotide-binding universal stress UspA family protein